MDNEWTVDDGDPYRAAGETVVLWGDGIVMWGDAPFDAAKLPTGVKLSGLVFKGPPTMIVRTGDGRVDFQD